MSKSVHSQDLVSLCKSTEYYQSQKKSKNGKKRLMKMKNKYPDRSKKQYCYEDWVNGRQYDCEVIQCCICMAWIHEECVLLDKHTAAVWTCKHCRRLPIQVEKIYIELSQV